MDPQCDRTGHADAATPTDPASHSTEGNGPDGPAGEEGLYLVVVVDVLADDVDTYGPMPGPTALRVAAEVQQLLAEHGPTGVLVTLARFHDRHADAHPDDP